MRVARLIVAAAANLSGGYFACLSGLTGRDAADVENGENENRRGVAQIRGQTQTRRVKTQTGRRGNRVSAREADPQIVDDVRRYGINVIDRAVIKTVVG